MMPAGHHSDSDSTLLPLPKSSITWFGGIFARLPPLAARLSTKSTSKQVERGFSLTMEQLTHVSAVDKGIYGRNPPHLEQTTTYLFIVEGYLGSWKMMVVSLSSL